MDRKPKKALHGAQSPSTEISPVEKRILFLVDEDAAAASGRSAGTKKKRKVKHGKGPEEKKAQGEVTQPALPPEELKRICLTNKRLEKWCHMPFFATTVTGCFVRAVFDDSFSDPPHCVAEIVSVIEMKNDYKIGSKRTNLVLHVRHAGEEQIVTLRSVSNQEFTKSEFKQWKLAMIAAGTKVPTPEMIASKEKSIKEALDHTFTQGELDFIVAKLKRFGTAPQNGTKRILPPVDKRSAARRQGDADKVERKVLVASAASAASGRSAGTKRKRQVEQDKTKRFQAAPLNVPKRKITLLEYQSAARRRGDADMVEKKVLDDSAASAGTKRKRQVEQDKGPEEKKARGEVNQPALPPE